MTGDLIKLALSHQRGLREQIAVSLLIVLDPSLEQLNDARALRQKNRKSLTDDVDRREELEIAAELVVVALLRLFHHGEMLLQHILRRESDTVNSLELLVRLIALPVSAGALEQLDRLDSAGGVEVRTRAEVSKITLTIERDLLALGKLLDELNLIRLVSLLHEGDSLVALESEALDEQILLNDLLHLGLDLREDVRRERDVAVDVIVEPGLDSRTDRELCLRVKSLDRLSEDMRSGVPEHALALGVGESEELDLGVSVDHSRQLVNLLVDTSGDDRTVDELGRLRSLIDADRRIRLENLVGSFKFDCEHKK